jgi:hypothetical protein
VPKEKRADEARAEHRDYMRSLRARPGFREGLKRLCHLVGLDLSPQSGLNPRRLAFFGFIAEPELEPGSLAVLLAKLRTRDRDNKQARDRRKRS